MVKSPAVSSSTRQTGLRTRGKRLVSFKEDSDSGEDQDVTGNDNQEEDEQMSSDSGDQDVLKILQEFKKQRAKKSAAQFAAAETEFKTFCTTVRKRAEDISREGIAYMESLKETMLSLRNEDVPYEKCLDSVVPLWHRQDAAIESLCNIYPDVVNDLFSRRAQKVEEISQTLNTNPERRKDALNTFLQNAHAQAMKSRQEQQVAADASKLIKHYRALLS